MALTTLSPSAHFFLGIDGGGSTTRALIGNESGSVWGYGEAAGSNPHERGISAAANELKAATAAAWANAGSTPQPFGGAFFGIAGAGSLGDVSRTELSAWLPRTLDATIEVDHDIRIALAGGLRGRPGIAVIAGTGSSGYARDAEGRTAQAGGWGGLIDDVGGGYWLGVKALSAVARAQDGRGPKTHLTTAVLTSLQGEDARQILAWLRRPDVRRPEIASLASLVFECALQEDAIAKNLIEEGARELGAIAKALANRLFTKDGADVVFTGGLSQLPEYRRAFSAVLAILCPTLRLTPGEHAPLVGALILALLKKGLVPSPEWLARADAASKRE